MAAVVAFPAHAGIGGAVKSIKDKAGKATSQKAGERVAPAEAPPEFGGNLLELTDARIEQVLKGLKAGQQGDRARADLIARRQKAEAELGTLSDKFGEAINEATRKRNDAEQCYADALRELRGTREREMQQKMMSDPALREKFMSMVQRMSMAQATGDTATVNKVQAEMLALSAPTHADTVVAQQKCGPMPAPHPMGARIESLQREAAAIDEQVRDLDRKSIDDQAKESGMTIPQFALALERIEMYLARVRANQPPSGFSRDELTALASHRPALEAAIGAS